MVADRQPEHHGRRLRETEEFLHRLDRNGEPPAYLFQCLRCGTHLASWDIG
ncbi:CbrC family protein [Micromonospora sp. NPDC049114]|uniref:CbrC family protein n=1 Tax=Micromonospora sp. NPDC049114 TaxID=3155498 RepID=UPI0033E797E4